MSPAMPKREHTPLNPPSPDDCPVTGHACCYVPEGPTGMRCMHCGNELTPEAGGVSVGNPQPVPVTLTLGDCVAKPTHSVGQETRDGPLDPTAFESLGGFATGGPVMAAMTPAQAWVSSTPPVELQNAGLALSFLPVETLNSAQLDMRLAATETAAFGAVQNHAMRGDVFNVFFPNGNIETVKTADRVVEKLAQYYPLTGPAPRVEREWTDGKSPYLLRLPTGQTVTASTPTELHRKAQNAASPVEGFKLAFEVYECVIDDQSGRVEFVYRVHNDEGAKHLLTASPDAIVARCAGIVNAPRPTLCTEAAFEPAVVGADSKTSEAYRIVAKHLKDTARYALFTPEGDFHVVQEKTDVLAELGVAGEIAELREKLDDARRRLSEARVQRDENGRRAEVAQRRHAEFRHGLAKLGDTVEAEAKDLRQKAGAAALVLVCDFTNTGTAASLARCFDAGNLAGEAVGRESAGRGIRGLLQPGYPPLPDDYIAELRAPQHQAKRAAWLKGEWDATAPENVKTPQISSRRHFLALAEACGAKLTGTPDSKQPVTVVFTIDAWRSFDGAVMNLSRLDPPDRPTDGDNKFYAIGNDSQVFCSPTLAGLASLLTATYNSAQD